MGFMVAEMGELELNGEDPILCYTAEALMKADMNKFNMIKRKAMNLLKLANRRFGTLMWTDEGDDCDVNLAVDD